MKKIGYLAVIVFILIVGVNRVSAGVVCQFNSFKLDFAGTTVSKNGFVRIDIKMNDNGKDVSDNLNTLSFSPNISDADLSAKVSKNDYTLCPKKIYIYKADYPEDDIVEYDIYSTEDLGLEEDFKNSNTKFEKRIIDLTDAYCYDCEYTEPVKDDEYHNYENQTSVSCGKVD